MNLIESRMSILVNRVHSRTRFEYVPIPYIHIGVGRSIHTHKGMCMWGGGLDPPWCTIFIWSTAALIAVSAGTTRHFILISTLLRDTEGFKNTIKSIGRRSDSNSPPPLTTHSRCRDVNFNQACTYIYTYVCR